MIFKHKSDRDALLEKVLRLSRDEAKYWRKISVVPDLTIKQRELERNVFKKAHDRKLNRTGDEQAKNLCDKVIGKRGEKVLRVLELRQKEIINQDWRGTVKSSPESRREVRKGAPIAAHGFLHQPGGQ